MLFLQLVNNYFTLLLSLIILTVDLQGQLQGICLYNLLLKVIILCILSFLVPFVDGITYQSLFRTLSHSTVLNVTLFLVNVILCLCYLGHVNISKVCAVHDAIAFVV